MESIVQKFIFPEVEKNPFLIFYIILLNVFRNIQISGKGTFHPPPPPYGLVQTIAEAN